MVGDVEKTVNLGPRFVASVVFTITLYFSAVDEKLNRLPTHEAVIQPGRHETDHYVRPSVPRARNAAPSTPPALPSQRAPA
jgi:hypothetical protein